MHRHAITTAGRAAVLTLTAAFLATAAHADTTVTMWTFLDPAKTSPREVALKQMIEDFEAENPGIKVRVEPQDFAQMPPKFFLGHRTGNNPDVVWIDAKNLGGLQQSGAGADLEKLIVDKWAPDGKADFFVEAGWEAARHEGELVALPLFHGASVIYYRSDLLAEAGIDPETLSSWDGIATAAKALTKDNDGDGRVDVWGFGMPLAPLKTESTPLLIGMLEGGDQVFDGCKANFDTEAGRRALTFTVDLINNGVTPKDALVYNVDDITEQFAAGRYAIAITSILRYSVIAKNASFGAENIGVIPWPTWDGEGSGPMPVSGWWVAAWNKSPHLEEAGKFIDYMVSPAGVKLWSTVGGQVPTRRSLLEDDYFKKPENGWVSTMIDAWSANSWMEPTACNTRTLQSALNEATARVLVDGIDPGEALKEAAAKFDDAQ
ncbi:ABC transporter substrate-binding protein [Acuticoccus kandeliae]|uniref:ABC transporter substrate-binding protein n=1 Tax=Acuticoccus kandeliae TaxID=2073160 RepID=UPI000D3E0D08|nr:sugar ABC transporter substrate-binding protein [Acuticoccus kandeliae]